MTVIVHRIIIPPYSTIDHGYGMDEEGRLITFMGDHRPMREVGLAIAAAHGANLEENQAPGSDTHDERSASPMTRMLRSLNKLFVELRLSHKNFQTQLARDQRTLVVTYQAAHLMEALRLQQEFGGSILADAGMIEWRLVRDAERFANVLLTLTPAADRHVLNACLHAVRRTTPRVMQYHAEQ